MYDLITFGETMLRLVPPDSLRLEDTPNLEVTTGGAESNVAVNLARLGKKTAWFSKLPDTSLGHTARNAIRHHGVDVSHVIWSDKYRMGLYFVEYGVTPRGIRVIYDRKDSAASHLQASELPLDAISNARWLHLTGITPALSQSCAEAAEAAMAYARNAGKRISFDVNYRALLWDAETCVNTITPFCETADVVFVALRDAVNLWGAPDDTLKCAVKLQKDWGGKIIVSNGSKDAAITDGENAILATSLKTEVKDRLGAGDALASGVLYQLMEDRPLDYALNFGLAMAALALTVRGDFALVTLAEVEAVLKDSSQTLLR